MKRLVALASVLAVALLAPSTAHAGQSADPLSDDYCTAFGEFYEASLVVDFAVSLASTFPDGADDPDAPDAQHIRAIYLVVLSPRLESVARELSHGGDRALARAFRRQRKVFERGVELLREAGLSRKHVAALRGAELEETEADLEGLLGDVGATQEDIEKAARAFLPELDKLTIGVNRRVSEAFERAGAECGVLSSAVDCDAVFPQAEAQAILGTTTEQDGSGCDFEATEGDGLAPEVAVEVYESPRAFGVLSEVPETEPVAGVGDEAVAFEGFSAYAGVKTCGRTLLVRAGDRTLVVALCLAGDAAVSTDQLVEIARRVVERIDRASGRPS